MAQFPQTYMIRKKVLALIGAKFHFYTPSGQVFAFMKQKAFKLKEDIRIYTDETMSQELVLIKARNIIDFSAAYDVIDSKTGANMGTWRRKGFSSLVRDSWELLIDEQCVARLEEDSMALALVRRLLCNLIPQHYYLRNNAGSMLAQYDHHFNPFIFKIDVKNLCPETDERMSTLIAAGATLLGVIEGRQR